jgi:hypothetical protein
MVVSFRLDLLGILVVNAHDVAVGMLGGLEEFVKLCVNGLGIPVFGSLYYERHSPSGEHRKRVPFQAVPQHVQAMQYIAKIANAAGRGVSTPICVRPRRTLSTHIDIVRGTRKLHERSFDLVVSGARHKR